MDQDSDKTVVPSNLLGSARDIHNEEQDASDTLPVGTRLGEFEILGLVGKGGFGIVYRAYDHSLECEVALKEYMPSGLASRSQTVLITVRSRADVDMFNMGLQSFIKEARMLRRFDSPSLVKVFRFWEANGTAYMVMPFYAGMTLKQSIKTHAIVPDEAWIRFFLTNLLDAIDIIHKENCYHRDIAPDNVILLASDGHPVLLDFGAARRVISDSTQLQTAILKPGFAPIEQYADIPGFKQGPWTDIYALGALVYYLISGKAPVAAVSRVVSDNNVPAREAGKGRFSPSFLHAIDRAIAVRPENRLQTATALREALGLPQNVSRTAPPSAKSKLALSERIEPTFPEATSAGNEEPAENWHDAPFFRPPAGADRTAGVSAKRRKMALVGSAALAALVVMGAGVYWGTRAPSSVQAASKHTVEKPASEGVVALTPAEVGAKTTNAVLPGGLNGEQKAVPSADLLPATTSPAGRENPARQLEQPEQTAQTTQTTQTTPLRQVSAEEQLWTTTLVNNQSGAYEAYLKAYPAGRYAAAATKAVERFALAAAAGKRTEAPAKDAGTPATGDSESVADRSGQVKTPAARDPSTDEDNNWRVASSMDNSVGYESYLGKYPNGKFAAQAKSKIDAWKKSGSSGLLASADTSRPADSAKLALPAQAPKPSTAEIAPIQLPSSAAGEPAAAIARINAAAAPKPADTTSTETAASAAAALRTPDAGKGTQASGQVLRIGNQTLTGSFSHDPVTGLVSGTGHVSWANGDRFEGSLARGIKQGRGEFIWANGQRYRGDWARDLPNGKGTMTFQNGNVYEGDMRDGVPNGRGTLTFSDGQRYRGELKDGLPHGKGVTRFSNGDSYNGDWRLGKSHGFGRYVWSNGGYWEGEFKEDKRTDNGKMLTAAEASANGAIASTGTGKERIANDPSDEAMPDLKN